MSILKNLLLSASEKPLCDVNVNSTFLLLIGLWYCTIHTYCLAYTSN